MRAATIAFGALLIVGACSGEEDAGPAPQAEATDDPTVEGQSIIRSDVEEAREIELAPLAMTIGFPEGGAELDEGAREMLGELLDSQQFAAGGKIILRGHSDSSGSDAANMRASLARGEAIRDYLVDKGVSEDRFDVIVFGEQNPVEPNALPDGEPNAEGRAANRRVEITIENPAAEQGEPDATNPSEAARDEAGEN